MNIQSKKVNKDVFMELLELTKTYDWLKEKQQQSALIDLWNLCELSEQQELLKELFSRFCYLTHKDKKNTILEIIKCIEEKWLFESDNTYIAAIADSDEIDGSIAHLNSFKTQFNYSWSEQNLIPTIGRILHKLKEDYKPNLVLFDDFVGTGNTLLRKTKWLKNTLDENQIFLENIKIVTFAGMGFGVNMLTQELKIELFTPNILKKGISDFEEPDQLEQKKHLMKSLEQVLQSKYRKLRLKDYSLGYGQSEALYQLEDSNCSNNVFPVFWWPTLKNGFERETLFRRIR